MDLIIGNPAGWWGLLGVPAILVIHLLQHTARRHSISTFFLVEHLAQESSEGRVLERIRNSAQLWLQLLAVLLVTWLLLQPRWMREDSFQRVVVVLDSSVSMGAFLDRLPDRVSSGLGRMNRAAARTEWRLIETDRTREALYAGLQLGELVGTLRDWKPRLGTHSFAPGFQVARSLAGEAGSIVLVTDRLPQTVPDGVEVLAIGEPVENVGFTGLRMVTDEESGALTWQAMVRNHGQTVQRRSWNAVSEWGQTGAQTLELDPGATLTLRGTFPDGGDALTLALTGDAFAMDDRLPVVRPQPKRLRVSVQVDDPTREFVARLLSTVRDREIVRRSEDPDLELLSYDLGMVPALTMNAICLPRATAGEGVPGEAAQVVHEAHALTEGLSWQALLCQPVSPVKLTGEEQVLLWMGDQPLIYLRSAQPHRQLVVAFDLASSNASRLPAFIVMLHRFVESVRMQKPVFEARNTEVNQLLNMVAQTEGGPLVRTLENTPPHSTPASRAHLVRAPPDPGLYQIHQDGANLLFASARFADSREADFSDAVTTPGMEERAEVIYPPQ